MTQSHIKVIIIDKKIFIFVLNFEHDNFVNEIYTFYTNI